MKPTVLKEPFKLADGEGLTLQISGGHRGRNRTSSQTPSVPSARDQLRSPG